MSSVSNSAVICAASSRVGDIIRQGMPPFGPSPLRTFSTAGIRNPRVLPVPVLALARQSVPVFLGVEIEKCAIISIMLTCDASVVVENDRRRRRRPRLCNAVVNSKYDNYRTEIYPSKHSPYQSSSRT